MEVEAHECMALSTIEVEYIATSETAKQGIWLQRLSAHLSAKSRIDDPMPTLYCDSQSAIHLIWNPVYHAKTKHIEVRYHQQKTRSSKSRYQGEYCRQPCLLFRHFWKDLKFWRCYKLTYFGVIMKNLYARNTRFCVCESTYFVSFFTEGSQNATYYLFQMSPC